MRKLILIGLLVLNGCATAARLEDIHVGMNRDEVVEQMGNPRSVTSDHGREVLWYKLRPDALSSPDDYGVMLEKGSVIHYGSAYQLYPPTAEQMRARQQMAIQAMQMMQMNQGRMGQPAAYQNRPMYQPPRPVQSNCTTRFVGGQAVTDCTSQTTGVDTSIYGR